MNKLKELSKKKWLIVLVIVLLITLVGSLGTYAMFSWISTDNTNVTLKIADIADVTFPQGQELNTNNLTPVFNYNDGETLTFSIKNKDTSGAYISYTVNFNITNIDEELANSSLKYKLVSGNNVIGEGDFSTATNNSTMKLANGMLSSGTTNFTFYLYIDSNIENNPNMMNKNIRGVVEVTASEVESEADVTLTKLGLTVDTTHTPNFAMISGNNGVKKNGHSTLAENQGDGTNGIYEAQDDLGTSYYFRGAVQNNYVKFGGVLWRIVRINGDGTIRITLNQDNGCSAYNENDKDNAYVGYMYGTAGSSTYADTHANTDDSTIKTYLDTWYQANLLQYEDKIADAIYCNDREAVNFTYSDSMDAEHTFSGTGIGTEYTAYAGYKRIFIDHTPSLICPNNNDKFTVSNSLGNGVLTYSIGLLTLDEYQMAGAGAYDVSSKDYYYWDDSTNAFYLYDNNYSYWSMTPIQMDASGGARVGGVDRDGIVVRSIVNDAGRAVRPAVSLKSSSITSGSGTSVDPFVVGGTNDSVISVNKVCSGVK